MQRGGFLLEDLRSRSRHSRRNTVQLEKLIKGNAREERAPERRKIAPLLRRKRLDTGCFQEPFKFFIGAIAFQHHDGHFSAKVIQFLDNLARTSCIMFRIHEKHIEHPRVRQELVSTRSSSLSADSVNVGSLTNDLCQKISNINIVTQHKCRKRSRPLRTDKFHRARAPSSQLKGQNFRIY